MSTGSEVLPEGRRPSREATHISVYMQNHRKGIHGYKAPPHVPLFSRTTCSYSSTYLVTRRRVECCSPSLKFGIIGCLSHPETCAPPLGRTGGNLSWGKAWVHLIAHPAPFFSACSFTCTVLTQDPRWGWTGCCLLWTWGCLKGSVEESGPAQFICRGHLTGLTGIDWCHLNRGKAWVQVGGR